MREVSHLQYILRKLSPDGVWFIKSASSGVTDFNPLDDYDSMEWESGVQPTYEECIAFDVETSIAADRTAHQERLAEQMQERETSPLKNITFAQVENYIDNTATNLAGTRTVLKKLARYVLSQHR